MNRGIGIDLFMPRAKAVTFQSSGLNLGGIGATMRDLEPTASHINIVD